MLQFADVLELVVHTFYEGPFSQQYLFGSRHALALHVPAHFGQQLYAVVEEQFRQGLGDIALVPDQVAEDVLGHGGDGPGVAVVDVPLRQVIGQKLALVVDYQVKLEPEEPSHRAVPLLGEAPEHPVLLLTLDVAGLYLGGIDEVDAARAAHAPCLQKQHQGYRHAPLQLHETVVGQQPGEKVAAVGRHEVQVVVLEVGEVPVVEHEQYGDHLRVAEAGLAVAGLLLPARQPQRCDKVAAFFAKIIHGNENIGKFVFQHGKYFCYNRLCESFLSITNILLFAVISSILRYFSYPELTLFKNRKKM